MSKECSTFPSMDGAVRARSNELWYGMGEPETDSRHDNKFEMIFIYFFLNLSTLFRYLYSDEKNIFLFKIVQNSDYRRHMKNKKHITQNQHCKDHLFFVFEIVTRINTLNGNYNTFSSYF